MTLNKGTIAVEGMRFHAYHGYYEEERKKGNEFVIDVYVNADIKDAAKSDQLKDTINYEIIYSLTEEVMQEKFKLLEHVAYHILERLGEQFGTIKSAKVKVSKLQPPINGKIDSVSIELEKTY